MSYELNDMGTAEIQYGDAGFVGETPTVTIEAGEAQQVSDEQIQPGAHDTSAIPAPDDRGEEAPLIFGATAYEEENDLGFPEEEYYLGQGHTTEEYEAPTAVSRSRTVYVAANYVPNDSDGLPEGVVDLTKKELPVAAADVPPENPPTDEATTPAEESNDARAVAEKIVEIENIPHETTEDREARTETLTNVVQDAIDTSRALEAAEQELETYEKSAEDLVVQTVVSGDILTSDETEEQRNERIDRVASALSDAALAEEEQRSDEDRDPGDLLTEFVNPSDVTRLGFTEGKVDIAPPPAPVETGTPAETSTVLQPGETRILSEDGWATEHTSEYDPTMSAFVNAPVGTALVGKAPEAGTGQTYNANSEGCRIVTLWKPEASGLVHVGPEDMNIGTDQIDSVISIEPALAGPTVIAHVIGDVETSPLGEEITSGQNDQLVSHLQSRGIQNITVVSQGRGKDVSLGVKTGQVNVKDADGGQIYSNRPPAASSDAATE